MSSDNCFVWNVRGLNGRDRRNVVRDLVSQERATLVCLQETKLSTICNPLANEILGSMFDYDYLPSLNVAGGILLGWHRDHWVVSDVDKSRFSLSAKVARAAVPQECWWITVVCGPLADQDKLRVKLFKIQHTMRVVLMTRTHEVVRIKALLNFFIQI